MKFLLLLLLCIGRSGLITADCIIDELDIVLSINRQPKNVCSFRNEYFYEGRSVRECNIDCTCMLGRLTCCSKSKTHCQRTESCRKVIFDFNTSLFTRSSVLCEEKVKTRLVPVYNHISKEAVKSNVVTIPPPQQIEPTTPAKIVELQPENEAQRKRRLIIERIMRINRARRRNLANSQRRRKAAAKSTSVKKSSSTSKNSSQIGMSLLDRLRYNRARRRKTKNKKERVASAQVDKVGAASENVTSGIPAAGKVKKQATVRLTFEQMLKKNQERRLRRLRKKSSKESAAFQSNIAPATKENKQAPSRLTFEEIMKKNHESRLRKLRQKLSKGTAAVQDEIASANKEEKLASGGLTTDEILRQNRERRNKKRKMLNANRSSY